MVSTWMLKNMNGINNPFQFYMVKFHCPLNISCDIYRVCKCVVHKPVPARNDCTGCHTPKSLTKT